MRNHRPRRLLISALTLIVAILLSHAPAAAQVAVAARPDLGDAPDASNSLGKPMEAYPGVSARFPTVAATIGGGPPGPIHRNGTTLFYLGHALSAEDKADDGPDADGMNNIRPLVNSADNDAHDDGLVAPARMGHCAWHEITYRVTTLSAARPILNVWADWDRDGAWSAAAPKCPDGGSAAEWAVQNQQLSLPAAGRHELTFRIRAWRPARDASVWLRIALSDAPAPAADGSGPPKGYALGETEDYLLELAGLPAAPPRAPALRPQSFQALVDITGEHRVFLPALSAGGSPPLDPDLPIGTPDGKLREVDVAHIGGSPNGPTPAIVVTAGGSGAAVRLSSWRIGNAPQTPAHLQDSPNIIGADVKLHVLTPDITPKLQHELLISAVRRDGDLWLTTWRVNAAGDFTQLSTRGYGSNARVEVKAYAIAHRERRREGALSAFQVATPILSADNQLRLITWSVNPSTGAISGLHDSGDWQGDPDPSTQLSAARIAGDAWLSDYFAVSYRSADGLLANSFWALGGGGLPSYQGRSVSGLDIRGNDEVEVEMRHAAIAALTDKGMLSATHDGLGGTRLIAWDNQLACFGDSGCQVRPHFISDQAADEAPASLGVQLDDPTLTANRALLLDALYDDELFVKDVGGTGFQGIASVTKVMTLILALDAVAAGDASLDDIVTTSAAAAAVGGSQVGLEEGEQQSLRTMLYGLMVDSGNDAALAIGEHIGGDSAGFVDMMNQRAAELGMDDSVYCQAAGGCFSTPADQVALWRSVYTDPVFQQFAGPVNYVGCGEGAGGEEICHFFDRSMASYPGQDSNKGGSLGFFCPSEPSTDGVPLCASGGCLSAQATRLNRTLIQSILQPGPLTANTGPDSRALFDYGYRQLYTPDRRGPAVDAGPAPDFGLDSVTDSLAVSAVIDGKTVKLCSWSALTWTGQLSQVGCASHSLNGLAASTNQPAHSEIELVLRSTLEADGDYLMGHRDGSDLVLTMWRLGPKD